MNLEVVVEENVLSIDVPDHVMTGAGDFFAKMDRDMDGGWQMSREWVDAPTPMQRCQIAADRLYTAINAQNETLAILMAGYILTRMPATRRVVINTGGDVHETEFLGS